MVHGYPNRHNAGAEWMLHEMLKHLAERGHECYAAIDTEPYVFEGVKVGKVSRDIVMKSDLIISHLKKSGAALNMCEYYGKPFVFIVHNSNYYHPIVVKDREIGAGRFAYVVYNSDQIKAEMRYPNPSMVIHPHVDSSRYKTKRGKKITLINLFERKGGKFFHDLARLMPDYEFMGVEGGYGNQIKEKLPNVSYMENQPDAKRIYAQTRILLMPSIYESYGRTAIEAMCSGIPVIAAPTPGLKESMGDAGIFCQLESPLKWVEAIKRLDDEAEYKKASIKAIKRAELVEEMTKRELTEMEVFFDNIINKRA